MSATNTQTLHIDSVVIPNTNGRIGMTACPGGRQIFSARARDLERDLAEILDWGAQGLVSLIEDYEFAALGMAELPQRATALGLWWRHLPFPDMCAPTSEFEQRWVAEGARLRGILMTGGQVVLHCWAGLGRTGTITARLLVELGTEPEDAIELVREARPGAIQSLQQEIHVRRCRSLLP